MPLSEGSDRFLHTLVEVFSEAADPQIAASMRYYMKDRFAFFGIPSPLRQELQRPLIAEYFPFSDPFDLADELFRLPQRELHYAACEILRKDVSRRKHPPFEKVRALNITVDLIRRGAWWDVVDSLAPNVAYPLIMSDPGLDLRTVATSWIEDNDFWLQRSAIIVQLKAKKQTDADLLFDMILRRADSREFFIRKGAGWALREYSKVNALAVMDFIEAHQTTLHPLTVREGMKWVNRAL